nr:hypothetical protein [Tanacetum cinerariifolium]
MDVKEPILDDVVNDADQPQDDVDPKNDKSTGFKQPPRPETPDPEWNKDPNHEKEILCINYKDKGCKVRLKGIKEMIPRLWIPIKVAYDRNAELGIYHPPKHQLFYISQINRISRHEVYSTMKILSVIEKKVDKQFE